MNAWSSISIRSLALAALVMALTTAAVSRPDPVVREARDGSHDFDFEIGTWRTKLKRLKDPLSGSTAWLEYEGTTTVRPVTGGRANLAELTVGGAAGRFEGISLRLYDQAARQWSLNFANVNSGKLGTPSVGRFIDGRGEFHSQESFRGRPVLVRFVIQPKAEGTIGFEQAFSIDGGRSWEVNWIATDTRIEAGAHTGETQASARTAVTSLVWAGLQSASGARADVSRGRARR